MSESKTAALDRQATRPPRPSLPGRQRERLDVFLARLRRMSRTERVRASRYSFNRWERSVWAGRYPDEVPLINGEVEWIALGSVDLE